MAEDERGAARVKYPSKAPNNYFASPEFLARYKGRQPLEVISEEMEEFLFSLFRIEEFFSISAYGVEYVRRAVSPSASEKDDYSDLMEQIKKFLPRKKQHLVSDFETALADIWLGENRFGKAIAFVFGMKIAGASPEEIKKQCQIWKL